MVQPYAEKWTHRGKRGADLSELSMDRGHQVCEVDQLGERTAPGFLANARAMVFRCPLADAEAAGDFLVRVSCSQQSQHLPLALRQLAQALPGLGLNGDGLLGLKRRRCPGQQTGQTAELTGIEVQDRRKCKTARIRQSVDMCFERAEISGVWIDADDHEIAHRGVACR